MSEFKLPIDDSKSRLSDALAGRTKIGGLPFKDLAHMSEDERIGYMGQTAMLNQGRTVAVLVELNDPGKGDRYIRKFAERFPEIVVMNRKVVVDGPHGTEAIHIQYPDKS